MPSPDSLPYSQSAAFLMVARGPDGRGYKVPNILIETEVCTLAARLLPRTSIHNRGIMFPTPGGEGEVSAGVGSKELPQARSENVAIRSTADRRGGRTSLACIHGFLFNSLRPSVRLKRKKRETKTCLNVLTANNRHLHSQVKLLHSMFVDQPRETHTATLASTKRQSIVLCEPQERNTNNRIFGGMRSKVNTAWQREHACSSSIA